jgi:hypothetical protein
LEIRIPRLFFVVCRLRSELAADFIADVTTDVTKDVTTDVTKHFIFGKSETNIEI